MARIVEAYGYKWYVPDAYKIYLAIGPHEDNIVRWWLSRGYIGGEFVDAGSHVGIYSIRLHRLFDAVYAFDPNPLNYQTLLKNVELNGISNIKVFNVALWDHVQALTLYQKSDKDAGQSVVGRPLASYHKAYEVEGRPLDSFNFRDVRLIKIDVEGSEFEVLEGLKRTLSNSSPSVIVEVTASQKEKVVNFMSALGYNYTIIYEDPSAAYMLFAHVKSLDKDYK